MANVQGFTQSNVGSCCNIVPVGQVGLAPKQKLPIQMFTLAEFLI